ISPIIQERRATMGTTSSRPLRGEMTFPMGRYVMVVALGFGLFTPPDVVEITTIHNSPLELRTKAQLEHVLATYNLKKYTFTREVVIEERAINHAFPKLTLNVRFADSPDELLSSFVHEQLHWHLRDHSRQQQDAIATLRRFYPRVPVGGAEG